MRLSTKVILLVSLPLAFQLGVSFFLFDQLSRAEQSFEAELYRKRIVASLDEIEHLHVRCLAAAAFYSISQDESVGDKHLSGLKQLAGELKHLRELTDTDPVLQQDTQELQKAVLAVVPYEMLMRKMSLMESKLQMPQSARARELIKDSLHTIEAYQSKLLPPLGDVESFKRSAFDLELKLALVVVLIATGSLVVLNLLQRNVVQVIEVLTQQIRKFRRGETLTAVIKGKDESASLEKVLIESANRITSLERLRRELCSIVSHDIRTPMTSISGLVTLLEAGALVSLTPEVVKLVAKLEKNSEELLSVLNLILDLDKLRSNSWPFRIEERSGDEICRRIKDDLVAAKFPLVETVASSGVFRCDLEAVSRAVLAFVQEFAERDSAVKIECGEMIVCSASALDQTLESIRGKATLSLAALFCEQQRLQFSNDTAGSALAFSIKPIRDSEVNVGETNIDKKKSFSRIGKSLLVLVGRPLAASTTAIVLLWLLLGQVGHQLEKEVVSRELVHSATRMASDMTHLMLLSIRRTASESDDYEPVRKQISGRIDQNLVEIRALASKGNLPLSKELELVQHKADTIKSLSQTMSGKTSEQLTALLKKLVANGELSSIAFTKAGSLLSGQAQLDTEHAALMSKVRSHVLLVLIGTSLVTAVLTIVGAIQVSRGFARRFNNVADNARRLASGQPLHEALPGHDEIADLDKFFFESANKIAKLEADKNEMAALLREQLKAPLLVLEQGFVSILESEDLSEKGKKLIGRAVTEIARLSLLADDLLLLDRIEESDQISLEVDVKATPVDAIVQRAIDAVITQARLKNIDIVFGGASSIIVNADASRSVQILVNFLSNAVKFSDEGKAVQVDLVRDGSNVRIVVIDSGRGIPSDQTHKIFSRFEQVEQGDTKKGSGLGLYICKRIAEAQRGSVGFDSKEGSGSKFWLVVPAGTDSQQS